MVMEQVREHCVRWRRGLWMGRGRWLVGHGMSVGQRQVVAGWVRGHRGLLQGPGVDRHVLGAFSQGPVSIHSFRDNH